MMRRARLWQALAASLALGAGAAVIAQPSVPRSALASKPGLSGCSTAQGSVHFDFEGASRSACHVEDERTIAILVTPEHQSPINPSPWYAFRYIAAAGSKFTVTVRYHGARHRYVPRWYGRGDPAAFSAVVAADGSAVSITLPPGHGIISAQPLMMAAQNGELLNQLAAEGGGKRLVLGRSLDGRPIEGVRLGRAAAPRLIVLLGRQHPPEVTGAIAMAAFTRAIAGLLHSGAIDHDEFQFLIVPMLNPDGVARGHWRANLGGMDLNRDWGTFSQPETRAVRDWLIRLPIGIKPVLMLDFHSTNRNVFYVQGDEATDQGSRFLAAWLDGKENAFAGYPFAVEPRDAAHGSGTTKNWFSATYGIPAYTYEVGDETDPAAVRTAAQALAQNMIPALVSALKEIPGQ